MDTLAGFQSLRVSTIVINISFILRLRCTMAAPFTKLLFLGRSLVEQSTMERCSEIVAHAYAVKPEKLLQFQGELPPNHKAGHRRHR